MFCDEFTLQSRPNGKQQIRRAKGDRLNPNKILRSTTTGACKINLWAFITPDGVGDLYSAHGEDQYIVRYVKNRKVVRKKKYPSFNSDAYLKVLKIVIPKLRDQYGDFWFVQDNVSFHKTPQILSYLKSQNVTCLPHPHTPLI